MHLDRSAEASCLQGQTLICWPSPPAPATSYPVRRSRFTHIRKSSAYGIREIRLRGIFTLSPGLSIAEMETISFNLCGLRLATPKRSVTANASSLSLDKRDRRRKTIEVPSFLTCRPPSSVFEISVVATFLDVAVLIFRVEWRSA